MDIWFFFLWLNLVWLVYAEKSMVGFAPGFKYKSVWMSHVNNVWSIGYCDCIPYFLFSDDHLAYQQYRHWDKLHHSGFDRDLLIYFFETLFLHALPTTNITTIDSTCALHSMRSHSKTNVSTWIWNTVLLLHSNGSIVCYAFSSLSIMHSDLIHNDF